VIHSDSFINTTSIYTRAKYKPKLKIHQSDKLKIHLENFANYHISYRRP